MADSIRTLDHGHDGKVKGKHGEDDGPNHDKHDGKITLSRCLLTPSNNFAFH